MLRLCKRTSKILNRLRRKAWRAFRTKIPSSKRISRIPTKTSTTSKGSKNPCRANRRKPTRNFSRASQISKVWTQKHRVKSPNWTHKSPTSKTKLTQKDPRVSSPRTLPPSIWSKGSSLTKKPSKGSSTSKGRALKWIRKPKFLRQSLKRWERSCQRLMTWNKSCSRLLLRSQTND